ncbi:MAG: LPP20 family lipoprotein [Bacteroidota bacterium]
MKLFGKGLSVLLGLLFIASTSWAQKAPNWYDRGSLPDYPQSQYITGVAAASSPEAASDRVSKEIAEQIRVNIQSTTESVQKEVMTNNSAAFQETFESAVTSTVNETISGIEVVRQSESSGTFYVFGVLDKNKYLNSLRGRLDNQKKSIRTLVDEADQFASNGKIVAAIDNYSSAMEQIPKFYSDKSLYDALSDTPYPLAQQFAVSDIESELRNLLSNIEIDVISGNRQTGMSGEPLSEPINFKLLYRYRGNEVTLSGVTVKASYKDGATIDRVATDQNGEASILAEAVPPSRGDRGEIELQPMISNLPYGYREYTRNAGTSVIYTVSDQMPLILAVDIRDDEDEPLDRVNDKVARSLERLGHTVVDDAPLKLDGTVSVVESREVETMGKSQTLVRAELSTKIKVAATGEVIGTFATVEEGLSTSGEKAAMRSAYNRMRISRRDFSDFVARSSNKLESIFGDRSKEYLEEGKQLMEQEQYKAAVEKLKMVTYGQSYVREARDLMREALGHMSTNMAGNSPMAGYNVQKMITFDEYGQGDFAKEYGESVVIKGSAEEEKHASVFKDNGEFSLELPSKSENMAVQIRAKVANSNSLNQRLSIDSDKFSASMIFNQGYYRKATFGSTTKDLDSIRELEWDNYGANVILFTIEKDVIKAYVNGKFFGAKEVDSTSGKKVLKLSLGQDDAIYGITVGTK